MSTSLTTVHVEDGEQENDPSKPLVDDTLVTKPDGTTTITNNDRGGSRYITTIKPDGSGNQVIIDVISEPGSSTGGGSGSGGGTGGGSTGGSGTGGSCGGPSQSPCTIDDSGFAGKSLDISAIKAKLDGAPDAFKSVVSANSDNPHNIGREGFFSDFRFGIPAVACQNPDLNFGAIDLTFDVCTNDLVQLMRQVEAWLLYTYTVFYIWRRFMSAEQVQGA